MEALETVSVQFSAEADEGHKKENAVVRLD